MEEELDPMTTSLIRTGALASSAAIGAACYACCKRVRIDEILLLHLPWLRKVGAGLGDTPDPSANLLPVDLLGQGAN